MSIGLGIKELLTGDYAGVKQDEGFINLLRKVLKYAGMTAILYEASKKKSNEMGLNAEAGEQETEAGEIPSPKRMKFDQSNELFTSDECNENTENEKLQTGILM